MDSIVGAVLRDVFYFIENPKADNPTSQHIKLNLLFRKDEEKISYTYSFDLDQSEVVDKIFRNLFLCINHTVLAWEEYPNLGAYYEFENGNADVFGKGELLDWFEKEFPELSDKLKKLEFKS